MKFPFAPTAVLLASISMSTLHAGCAASPPTGQTPAVASPATERTPVLERWEAMKYGAFIHFGMSTFKGDEFGRTPATPGEYNPTDLDVDQWIKVARDAGMKYTILTTKHCYGHCLWPSKFTENSVKNGPVKTDVVKAYVKACRKYDVKPGLYYLLGWDWENQSRMTPDQYEAFCLNQLTELLTGYGPIPELWLDIPWDMGPDTSARLGRIYAACKKIQPECLILLNNGLVSSTEPGRRPVSWKQHDIGGTVRLWPTDILDGEETQPPATGHVPQIKVDGKTYYLPFETDDCLNRHWFWIEGDHPKSLPWLVNRYRSTIKRNANWVLDIAPDRRGRIPQEQIDALMALKKESERLASLPPPLNLGAKATASNTYLNDPSYGPASAVDDDTATRWATDVGTTSAWLEVDLGKPREIGRIVVEQAYPELKRIRRLAVEYWQDGQWKACHQGDGSVAHLDAEVKPFTAQRVRLNITEGDAPTVFEFSLYPPADAKAKQ